MVNVLDHGFVELLELMGSDDSVARAARLSYGPNTERSWEQDAKLTRYLAVNHHDGPFEMIEVKFQVKAPIFVARQWMRHRSGNFNEFSQRYSDPKRLGDGEHIDYYLPDHWRYADPANKQGSIYTIAAGENDIDIQRYRAAITESIATYHKLQAHGVANEMARMVLPVAVYTEFIYKTDLRNLLHFLELRCDAHAQWEIQRYAWAIVDLLKERLPRLMEVVWEGTDGIAGRIEYGYR